MLDKRIFSLPRSLIRRFGTRDPFEIAEKMNITVLLRNDFVRQKGAYFIVKNNKFIAINAQLSPYMQKLVCAHELGHALLHPKLCSGGKPYMEFEIMDMNSITEYEANVFAANILIDEDELLEMVIEGRDVVYIARAMNTNVNVILIKLREMEELKKLNVKMPDAPARDFLGKIGDNADY